MVGVVGSSPIAPTNELNEKWHPRVPFFIEVRQKYGSRSRSSHAGRQCRRPSPASACRQSVRRRGACPACGCLRGLGWWRARRTCLQPRGFALPINACAACVWRAWFVRGGGCRKSPTPACGRGSAGGARLAAAPLRLGHRMRIHRKAALGPSICGRTVFGGGHGRDDSHFHGAMRTKSRDAPRAVWLAWHLIGASLRVPAASAATILSSEEPSSCPTPVSTLS